VHISEEFAYAVPRPYSVSIIKFVYGWFEMVCRQHRGEGSLSVPYDPTAIAKLPSIEMI
jgi:hypothetical protein